MENLSEEKNGKEIGEEIGEKESLSVEKRGKKGKELIEKKLVVVEPIATPEIIPKKPKRILSELQLQTVRKNLALGRLKRKNQTERILPTKIVREDSDDDEEDLVAVQKMAKKKKAPRIVYVSESESEEEQIIYKKKAKRQPPPPLQQQIPKPNNLYKAAARLFA